MSSSSKPAVSTSYRWANGHTVADDGKRVIPLINVRMMDGSLGEQAEFFKLLKYAVTEVGFLYLQCEGKIV
jgi:hypothetical protein